MTQRVLVEIPDTLSVTSAAKKIFLESAPYVMRGNFPIRMEPNLIIVDEVPLDHPYDVKALIQDSLSKSIGSVERVQDTIIEDFQSEYTPHDDIIASLLNRGDIYKTGEGKFVHSGQAALVFRGLDDLFRSWAMDLGSAEEYYPVSVQADSLRKIGYFDTFAQHAYFIMPLKHDVDVLDKIKNVDALKSEGSTLFQTPDWVLAPTVCHHCFEARKETENCSNQTVTALNPCSRYEVNDVSGLQRLRHYWMREIVYFRNEKMDIQESLDAILKITVDTFKRWGLTFKVSSANDPFFLDSGTSKRFFQSGLLLKRELLLPIGQKDMACASFNNHLGTLCGSFEIGTSDPEWFSGCVGWGYDRLIYALFYQLGPETANWPATIRQDLGLAQN